MLTAGEIEKAALKLPEAERAAWAARLPDSLRAVLDDEDEGLAEAWRRDAEMNADLNATISLKDLNRLIAPRRH